MNLAIELFEHQLDTINSCLKLESQEFEYVSNNEYVSGISNQNAQINKNKRMVMTRVGILGNPVGSGKTLICIGLCMYPIHCLSGYISNHSGIYFANYTTLTDNLNVIVVPHYLYKQWVNTCELAQVNYFGISKKKEFTKFELQMNLNFCPDVLIVTNSLYQSVYHYFMGKKIARLIIDEADTIKTVPFTKFLKAEFTWLVSATHERLAWHQIFVNKFGNCSGIKKHVTIENNSIVELPEIIAETFYATMPLGHSIVSGVIKEISRALFAGDLENVKDIFRKKNSAFTEENFIRLATQDINTQIAKLKSIEQDKKSKKLEVTETLSEWESKKQDLIDRIQKEDFCIICYDKVNLQEKTITRCCDIPFCISCIIPWLRDNSKCPYCRKQITDNDIILIENKEIGTKGTKGTKGKGTNETLDKFELFQKLIEDETIKTPCIVYSDYSGSFDRIITQLPNKKCFQLSGRIENQDKMLTKFKNKEVDILFMNSQLMSAGLNLQFCDNLVMFQKLQQYDSRQVIGRCQRLGRINQLKLYKIFYPEEIEN